MASTAVAAIQGSWSESEKVASGFFDWTNHCIFRIPCAYYTSQAIKKNTKGNFLPTYQLAIMGVTGELIYPSVLMFIIGVGLWGASLDWFSSYLSIRNLCVAIGYFKSSASPSLWGASRLSPWPLFIFHIYFNALSNPSSVHQFVFICRQLPDQFLLWLQFKVVKCFLPLNSNKLEAITMGAGERALLLTVSRCIIPQTEMLVSSLLTTLTTRRYQSLIVFLQLSIIYRILIVSIQLVS